MILIETFCPEADTLARTVLQLLTALPEWKKIEKEDIRIQNFVVSLLDDQEEKYIYINHDERGFVGGIILSHDGVARAGCDPLLLVYPIHTKWALRKLLTILAARSRAHTDRHGGMRARKVL